MFSLMTTLLQDASPKGRYWTMELYWRAGVAAVLGTVVIFVILMRAGGTRQRKILRLESDLRQAERELLRSRGEHAKEVAELKVEHAKAIANWQRNVKDLTKLHQEKNRSEWDGWSQIPPAQSIAQPGETRPGA